MNLSSGHELDSHGLTCLKFAQTPYLFVMLLQLAIWLLTSLAWALPLLQAEASLLTRCN
jgi:hypothetical protein